MSFFVIESQSLADVQLSHLLQVGVLFALPLGLLLLLVLFRSATLLQTLWEVLVLSRGEVLPILQDVKRTASHVESITDSLETGVTALRQSPNKVKAAAAAAKEQVSNAFQHLPDALSNLVQAFRRKEVESP